MDIYHLYLCKVIGHIDLVIREEDKRWMYKDEVTKVFGDSIKASFPELEEDEKADINFCPKRVPDYYVWDLVSWNLMISGCVKIGFAKGALELFEDMKRDGFDPDEMTAVSVLRECGDIGNLELGKVVEEYFVENEMEMNYYVGRR
ncbi:Pentatricopeptide repeat-containing protein [Artemisia annua]|uniref:Pentatricopeptide repeat-containing protein n=1 Tax=Artemisia annua TaxID=35608 RepID=A0A2U1NRL2_ARTAN|nr:Pentatricopeptide repeat-containing protein [Artemisia annua]